MQDPKCEINISGTSLGKDIKVRHFFSLAFGCTIGVGWILVLGNWLELAGPLGAILGFAGGIVVIVVVGLCYAELASVLPVSGGEVAYAYEIFGIKTSFIIGWFLALTYISIISFEVISVGWIAGIIFPSTKGMALYSNQGDMVHLGSMLLGFLGMILIIAINYRGIKSAAVIQEVFTYGLLVLSVVFFSAGIIWGKTDNLKPLFSDTGFSPILGGILAIFMTAPLWLAGFNVIPQTMEEKAPGTSLKKAVRMIVLSILMGGCFYIFVILSASMATPWKSIISLELPAAGAFEAAFKSSLLAKVVLFAGLCGIITTWNTIFISATRIIFALGRARIIPAHFGKIHTVFRSPHIAIIFVGVIGAAGAFLGRSAILPLVNLGASGYSLAFLFTCLGVIRLRQTNPTQHRPYRLPGGIITAVFGVLSSLFCLFLSLYHPYINRSSVIPLEWIFILSWAILGMVFWGMCRKIRNRVSEAERRKLILGIYDS